MMNRHLFLVAPAALIILTGCHSSAPISEQQQAAVSAEVFTVATSNTGGGITVSAIVKPSMEADISAQIIAPITQMTKHIGDPVRRGEVLVRLHAAGLQASVAQANAAVSAAEQQSSSAETQAKLAADTLERYKRLSSRHSVTPHELEEIEAQNAAAQAQGKTAMAQVNVAQQALAVQQANASDALLLAPFDGVVTQRLADPGSLATPGSPILHLESAGQPQVQLAAPQDAMHSLHVGTKIEVSGDQHSPAIQATVSNISPAGDANSHSFLVKAVLPKTAPWKPGTVVSVALPSVQRTASIFIPTTALISQGGLDAVLVINDNHAQVRYITLGSRNGAFVEELSGLHTGDCVVAHGDLNLAGRRIEVRP